MISTFGRLAQRASTNPAGAGLPIAAVLDTWSFDPFNGPGLLAWQKRQLGFGLPQVWREDYTYEPASERLSSQTTAMELESPWTTSYSYDSLGREQTVSYPSGLVIRKGYTADGYLNSLSRDTDNFNYWTATAQDAWGNVTGERYNSVNTGTHSTYASTGQWIQKRWGRSIGNSEVERVDYQYDSFGNLKRQGRFNSGTVYEQYNYDRLQRLTNVDRMTATGPGATQYAYARQQP